MMLTVVRTVRPCIRVAAEQKVVECHVVSQIVYRIKSQRTTDHANGIQFSE